MKKLICSIAGALVTASSVAMITDYSISKKKQKEACPTKLVAGIVGLCAGALITYIPDFIANRKLPVDQMINEDEEDLMNENIAEVLGNSTEGTLEKAPPVTIELDEETTIEDFIFDA